jgi:hypothetical protein
MVGECGDELLSGDAGGANDSDAFLLHLRRVPYSGLSMVAAAADVAEPGYALPQPLGSGGVRVARRHSSGRRVVHTVLLKRQRIAFRRLPVDVDLAMLVSVWLVLRHRGNLNVPRPFTISSRFSSAGSSDGGSVLGVFF